MFLAEFELALSHRLQSLVESTQGRPVRVGIVSMYDVENNAVRILASHLRAEGHHVTEIYFKDWISNHLSPATDLEHENLIGVIREDALDIVCVSIRASAYCNSAHFMTEAIRAELPELPVLWGGMHPTLVPHECIEQCDAVLQGEGELALTDLMNRLRDGQSIHDTPNMMLRDAGGELIENALRPLVKDLDTLLFRDYTSHEDKVFVWGKTVERGDPMH